MSVPSTTQRSFYKDVQQLYRTVDSSTDGQATIESVDDISVRISLRPKTGNNAHATFYMSVSLFHLLFWFIINMISALFALPCVSVLVSLSIHKSLFISHLQSLSHQFHI
ncbi:unnamed protein product, partial [Hymenolepis diminuta]